MSAVAGSLGSLGVSVNWRGARSPAFGVPGDVAADDDHRADLEIVDACAAMMAANTPIFASRSASTASWTGWPRPAHGPGPSRRPAGVPGSPLRERHHDRAARGSSGRHTSRRCVNSIRSEPNAPLGRKRTSSDDADDHRRQRQARVGQDLEDAAAAEAPEAERDADRQADDEGDRRRDKASRSVTESQAEETDRREDQRDGAAAGPTPVHGHGPASAATARRRADRWQPVHDAGLGAAADRALTGLGQRGDALALLDEDLLGLVALQAVLGDACPPDAGRTGPPAGTRPRARCRGRRGSRGRRAGRRRGPHGCGRGD